MNWKDRVKDYICLTNKKGLFSVVTFFPHFILLKMYDVLHITIYEICSLKKGANFYSTFLTTGGSIELYLVMNILAK